MLKYSDQPYTTSISSSNEIDDSTCSTSDENKLSLIQLWEYIIKSKTLPDGVDLEIIFATIHERLKNPEWEVRQHALRVLVDLIPLIPNHTLDLKIEPVLGDLVTNLGHLGPAVRKGAVDSLRAYINCTLYPDKVITDLVERGIEKSQENKFPTNVVLGIILSLPFLIRSNLSENTVTYTIHRLLDKLVKVIHQETVLRALIRIREIIGHQVFNTCLDSYTGYNSRKDFELLCEVYDLHVFKRVGINNQFNDLSNKPFVLDDLIQLNDRKDTFLKTSEDDLDFRLNNTNVILETEIQLESGPAITMKILEEAGQKDKFIGVSKNDPFKVLPDEVDFYEFRRRTPRRVRFGGEIIKLRTPDSDSNQASDDNEATMSIYADNTNNKPIIEIKYVENEVKKSNSNKSQIPIPVKQTQSVPNSPKKHNLVKSKVFRSSPNLSKTKKPIPNQGKSRIPRRSKSTVKNIETKIQIKIAHQNIPTKEKKIEKKSENNKSEVKPKTITVPTKTHNTTRRNSREDEFSPIPVHNEIEVLHNLTRSPSPFNKPKSEITKLPDINVKNNNDYIDADVINPRKKDGVYSSFTSIPNLNKEISVASNLSSKSRQNEYISFQLCKSPFYDFEDAHIPTKDSGDCLTCSSSGSDSVVVDEHIYGQFDFLDPSIVRDLNNMNDMNARLRGLDSLKRYLEKPEVLNNMQDKLPSLLHLLFTLEQQPLLQPLSEQTLNLIFINMDTQCLMAKLHQIFLYLSKAGSPLGVRLAIVVMKRISPKIVIDNLLSESIIGAKSSKVREGALQIIMTVSRIFPSTEIDVEKAVKMILVVIKDRKRKVRKVALETVATLAQLSSNAFVLETANIVFNDCRDKEHILKVLRTRLSRKQLSVVNLNGNIRYSSPTGQSEIDFLSHGCEMAPPSKLRVRSFSARDLEDIENNNNLTSNNILKLEKSAIRRKRLFSAQTETMLSSTFSQEIERFITSSPERFVHDLDIERRRFLSAGYIESIEQHTYVTDEDKNSEFSKLDQFKIRGNTPNVCDNSNHLPDINKSPNTQESYKVTTSEDEETKVGKCPLLSSSSIESNGGILEVDTKDLSQNETRETKVNYWKINSRKYDHQRTPIENNEDAKNSTHTSQIWVVDSASLSSAEKVSLNSGTLRQIYLAGKSDANPNKYQDGGTNTTPILKRSFRGRSLSPPSSSRQSDYDSYDEPEPSRFINNVNKQDNRNESVRKSYSTEFLSPLERFRRDSTASSESSSGSCVRRSGTTAHKELRSGIPISIKDSKFRIRSKNVKKRREPVSISYYSGTKSPTPEKLTTPPPVEKVINRQPFSSGSESSGYFTPPPDSNNQGNTPEISPRLNPEIPDRFIQIETPKHSVENLIISDSESENCDNNDQNFEEITDVTFDRINTSSSLKESILHEINITNNKSLPDKELFKSETALDELDFTKISYSGKHALSKSEVDIQISTQISRKNINSAPAVADFENFNEITIEETTCLPGSVDDSIENTEAPDELFGCSPPKRSPLKTCKGSLRRKSTRILTPATPLLSDSRPFTKPKDSFHEIVEQLESSEWEDTMKGIKGLVVLFKFHKELVENHMHAICVLLGKHIRNLRSQVARASCLAASELFNVSKRPLEMELDELAAPLLQRTADTNKFLRSDANNALDEMSANLSVPKVISVITYRGSTHQNAVVRCAAARLLCNIVHRLGPEKVFQLPRDTRDKIIVTGATMLTEGSLETRRHAKLLLGHLSCHCQFQRAITEAVPPNIFRLIEKTLRSIIN